MDRKRPEIGRSGWRSRIQLISLAAFNSYYLAPVGKYLCIPVLNCYSCPVGTVACPVGSIIAFGLIRRIPYYISGVIGLAAVSAGRGFCGWACPFGYMQDLLYRIRSWKWDLPRFANSLKYALLVLLVIALPIALGGGKAKTSTERITGESSGAIDYCGLVCPAGTAEAGVPSLITSKAIRAQASWRTYSKLGILAVVLGLAVVSRRSFCRALCPLGALMALSCGLSLLRLETDPEKCTRCRRCVKVCPTASRIVPETAGGKEASAECVMCLDCVRDCPEAGALATRFGARTVMLSRGKPNA
jgi:ferredoxin-type protein NapH